MMKIKSILSKLLSLSGSYELIERLWYSDKAFILTYHRVLASAENQPTFVQPGMFVSTVSFEKQIAFLKDHFEVLFFEDLVDKVLNGESINGLCAITFDDGWRDNYTQAFPILKKYCVPATIFLATGFVGKDKIIWPDELCYCLDRVNADKPAFEEVPSALICFNAEIKRYRQLGRERFFNKSIELLKEYLPHERQEILEYFRSLLNSAPLPRQMLSWDEAREMLSSRLVRFGAHTVNHEILDQVPLQKVRDEVSQCNQELERHLGCKVRIFAYPNGNHNEYIRGVLIENGFNAAVTTRKGFLGYGTSLMEIPRISIHEDVSSTIPMFRSRILLRKF